MKLWATCALALAVAACRAKAVSIAPAGRINIETEQVIFDAPVGWDVAISFPRAPAANALVWLSPPADQRGPGRMVVLTVADTRGRDDDDLTRRLSNFVTGVVHSTPAVPQRVAVVGAVVVCVEHVTAVEVTAACGLHRTSKNTRQALAWGFLQRVDPAFYRAVGGAPFLAGLTASLRDFAVIPLGFEQ